MTAPPSSDPPSVLAGRYVIERELGRGASAFVYLAHDRTHDRRVAVKVLRRELARSVGAERFLREVHVTARLQHPRIVSVLDAGAEGDQLFFVAPYLEGGTLRERIVRERQLPIGTAVAIAHAVASALDYAHGHGLIHRDVKPENILFAGDEACLGDFGIARVLDDPTLVTTSTGLVRGTPAYMSPEQASGEQALDARSDVYSLGCVLYEMLAGMPPFTGPTSQAVIAQRFTHPPEPLSRYRATVPPELEEIVRLALAQSPADRFATARAFAEALAATGLAHSTGATAVRGTGTAPGRPVVRRGRRWPLGVAAIAAVGAVGVWTAPRARDALMARAGASLPLDTTQLLVLPSELGVGVPAAARPDDQLRQAFGRWHGITLADAFGVSDALARDPSVVRTSEGARALARRLGVGRLVRARVSRVGDSLAVYAALFDVGAGRPLYQITRRVAVADAARGADTTFATLADSLLLRGTGLSAGPSGTTSLPAAQAMVRARAALDEWTLAVADSALQTALGYEAGNHRLSYWLAQVRAWRGEPSDRWRALAEGAAADAGQLSPYEQAMARALVALGRGDYAAACAAYQAIGDASPRDFGAWYGVGQCHDLDGLVVRDRASPSGWRFRSSYERAVVAFAHAFELLPATRSAFHGDAEQFLRDVLFTSAAMARSGYAVRGDASGGDTLRFIARPALVADTFAFVPYPEAAVAAAAPGTTPPSLAAAVRRGRGLFRRVTAAWSATLPNSAATKAAVASSLEMLGDASAVDTLELAQSLAGDPVQRTRLAVSRVLTTVKLALPDRPDELRRARRLVDSLFASADTSRPAVAASLLPLAALTARCDLAVALARRGAEPRRLPVPMSRRVSGDVDALLVAAAVGGCSPRAAAPTVDHLASALASPTGAAATDGTMYQIVGRGVSLAVPLDSAWVARLARARDDYLLAAQRCVLTHDAACARRLLLSVEPTRRAVGFADVTPDAVVPEARAWLALGDTAHAEFALDAALEQIRRAPHGMLDDAVNAASLTRAVELRAQLARARGGADRRWRLPLAILRGDAPDPGPTTGRP